MHPRPSEPLEAQERLGELFGSVADALVVYIPADSAESLTARAAAVDRALASPEGRRAGVAGTFGLSSLLPDPALVNARAARLASLDAGRIIADFRSAVAESSFAPEAFAHFEEFLGLLLSRRSGLSPERLIAEYPTLAATILSDRTIDRTDPRAPHEAITLVFFDHTLNDRSLRDTSIQGVQKLLASMPEQSDDPPPRRGLLPKPTLTGVTVVSHDLEQLIRKDVARVLAISLAAVLLTIVVAFHRIADIALSLIPVAAAVVAVVAYMATANERLNLAT